MKFIPRYLKVTKAVIPSSKKLFTSIFLRIQLANSILGSGKDQWFNYSLKQVYPIHAPCNNDGLLSRGAGGGAEHDYNPLIGGNEKKKYINKTFNQFHLSLLWMKRENGCRVLSNWCVEGSNENSILIGNATASEPSSWYILKSMVP